MTKLQVGLSAAILAVTDDRPRVLTLTHPASGEPSLPSGPLDPIQDRTLERGLRGWVREQAGLELGYVEQLYTFGDLERDPFEHAGSRVISVAYLALVREEALARGKARWRDVYDFFPWEDRRDSPMTNRSGDVLAEVARWAREAPKERTERADVAFGGPNGAAWETELVLERYEILWEAGLASAIGAEMALDHRRVLATALGRLRGKIRYRPIVFELMPETFTLLQLQRAVEALAGVRLHKQNFRRLLETGKLVEGTGESFAETGGRPAELFRFRHEVVRERPSAGVRFSS